jgi:glycosyltransferases involved in cell wall biogenesis
MISIVIPIYNAENFLKECLDSVRRQSFKDFEVLCVNDGSKDNSGEICKEYVARDSRFVYIEQENGGVSKARNTALNKAKGEWLCFIDSDDVVDTDFLLNLHTMAQDGDMPICGYTRNQEELGLLAKSERKIQASTLVSYIINESVYSPNIWTMLFNNNIIHVNNLRFTVGCVRNEDTEFYFKYMSYVNTVTISDYKGYYYRDNPYSAVHKFNYKSLTYIEASERIKDFLVEKEIIKEENLVVAAAVQYFIYHLARQGNSEIYEYLHQNYPVRKMMKGMLSFPKLSRKGVALVYMLVGKKLFFTVFSKFLKE